MSALSCRTLGPWGKGFSNEALNYSQNDSKCFETPHSVSICREIPLLAVLCRFMPPFAVFCREMPHFDDLC